MKQTFVSRWVQSCTIIGALSAALGGASPVVAQHSEVAGTAEAEAPLGIRDVLARPVTVSLDNVDIVTAVRAVARSAGVRIQFPRELLEGVHTPVTLYASKLPFTVALDRLFVGTRLRAVALDRDVVEIVGDAFRTQQLTGTISGHVIDAHNHRPLRGARIILDGTESAATTDDGTYRVAGVTAGSHALVVKLIGYAKVTRTISVQNDAIVTADVMLDAAATSLDQVVVTGTVIPTELKAVPNAITVITAKEIEQRGVTRIDELFHGDVPGLFALNRGTRAAVDQVNMFSRGADSFGGATNGQSSNPIKTYVDGVELADPQYLSQIDPKSIERIEILTGPQASTIYGSNALNGVMQIFTKRGTTSRPELTLNLQSGFVQNSYTPARTPQHEYSAQVAGVEGRMSYNAGGSWNYMGRWNPTKQTSVTSGFGGARLALPTVVGAVTADLSFRQATTVNNDQGSSLGTLTGIYTINGFYTPPGLGFGSSWLNLNRLAGQTFGLTLGNATTSWWSQEVGLGQDVSNLDTQFPTRGYRSIGDTSVSGRQTNTNKRSLHATTTAKIPLTSLAHATVTLGTDTWQSLTTSLSFSSTQGLTGTLNGTTSITRQPSHNTGAYVQGQLAIADQLFITYGLRAEWNPAYGTEALPNYAPRYGVAYSTELGSVTTKLRASYGRSTRPPTVSQKLAALNTEQFTAPIYGVYNAQIANPDLGPEGQQGGEGGMEFYFGNRASLIVTRYNQTVNNLILNVPGVDSVRSLAPNPSLLGQSCATWAATTPTYCSSQDAAGYWYAWLTQNMNVASLRNQGWELQGSLTTGAFTTRGTYSWTKSRVIGITPQFRYGFPPQSYAQYQPGATFVTLPEHVWLFGTTYTTTRGTIALNLTGTGQISSFGSLPLYNSYTSAIRLQVNRANVNSNVSQQAIRAGDAQADLTAFYRLSTQVDGVVDVQNLTNRYGNDDFAAAATIGRQTKAGLRIRL